MTRSASSPARLGAGALAVGAGGTVAIALVAWVGAQAIGAEVARAWWAVAAAVALHVLQLLLSARAWRAASGVAAPGQGAWLRIRWIREAVNSLLPVAQLGGNLVGIRLLAQRGVSLAQAAAGTTLDLTLEALTQFAFTLIGIATLAAISTDHAWRPWVGGGVALMAAGIGGFILAQRAGSLRLVEVLAARMSRFVPGISAEAVRGLHVELLRRQRDRPALLRAGGLHLVAWLLGVGETWLALAAMGWPVAAPAALVIESLGMAARSAGFAVPGALGVQEGGFLLVGSLFGVPPDTALALSMVKRARELAVGVPGLVAWQWAEGARLARRPRPAA